VGSSCAILHWKTASEQNNAGFEVQKFMTTHPGLLSVLWMVTEQHASSNMNIHLLIIQSVKAGRVSYRLKQVDRDGQFAYSPVIETEMSLSETDFTLSQNYPNPFNPTTNISFAVKERQFVSLKVYNLVGQEVATLVNGVVEPNSLQTVEFNGKDLSSGIYFYSLNAGNRHEVRKLMLMK
jgi:hypothetical protein